MTHAEAERILSGHPRIPIDAPGLIGFELLSCDVTGGDQVARIALAGMILDCNGRFGRAVPYHLAEATTGTLTLWILPPDPITQ